MKRYTFTIQFGKSAKKTISAGSVNSAAIIAVADRIENGLNCDDLTITDEDGKVYENVVVDVFYD